MNYLSLYLLAPGTEFAIAEMDDAIKTKVKGKTYKTFNKFIFEGMDGMYGKCLDLNLQLHFLHGSTKVQPIIHN